MAERQDGSSERAAMNDPSWPSGLEESETEESRARFAAMCAAVESALVLEKRHAGGSSSQGDAIHATTQSSAMTAFDDAEQSSRQSALVHAAVETAMMFDKREQSRKQFQGGGNPNHETSLLASAMDEKGESSSSQGPRISNTNPDTYKGAGETAEADSGEKGPEGPDGSLTCPVEGCDRHYKRVPNYVRHMREHGQEVKVRNCIHSSCVAKCLDLKGLILHEKRRHESLLCIACLQSFRGNMYYIHMQNSHKLYDICTECGQRFKAQREVHEGTTCQGKFECKCGRKFNSDPESAHSHQIECRKT